MCNICKLSGEMQKVSSSLDGWIERICSILFKTNKCEHVKLHVAYICQAKVGVKIQAFAVARTDSLS